MDGSSRFRAETMKAHTLVWVAARKAAKALQTSREREDIDFAIQGLIMALKDHPVGNDEAGPDDYEATIVLAEVQASL